MTFFIKKFNSRFLSLINLKEFEDMREYIENFNLYYTTLYTLSD